MGLILERLEIMGEKGVGLIEACMILKVRSKVVGESREEI